MGSCHSPQNRESILSETKHSHPKNICNGELYSTTVPDTESMIYSEETTSFGYPSMHSTMTNDDYINSDDDIFSVLNQLHQNGWSQQSLSSFIELINKNELEFDDIDNESEIIHDFLNKNINNNTIPKCALSDLKTVISQIKQRQHIRYDLKLDRFTNSYSTITNNDDSTINSDDVRSFKKPFCSGSSCKMYKGFYVPCGQLMALKVTSRLDCVNVKSILNEYEKQQNVLPECNQLMRLYGWYRNWRANEIIVALEYMNMGSIYDCCFNTYQSTTPIDILQSGHKQIKIKLNYIQLKHITKQCLLGLNALHMNTPMLIHSDIKPQNLLINNKGDVKIGDFGLLNVLKHRNDMCKIHKGTAKYFSPERINGFFNTSADIWSLGITLIEIYNGQLIDTNKLCRFKIVENGINVNDFLDENVPFEFIDFIEKCLIYDYKNRYSAELLLKHAFVNGLDNNNENIKNICFYKQFNDYNMIIFDTILMWLEEWMILNENNTRFFLDDNCEYLKLFVFNLANYSELSSEILFNILMLYISCIQNNLNIYKAIGINIGRVMREIVTFLL